MANPRHEPTDDQEKVLNLLKDGRDEDGPWGYTNPKRVRGETSLSKSQAEYALRELDKADWIRRVATGLYKFNEDPRESDEQ